MSDSVYLLLETVLVFLPFILICVFLACFPFFQDRINLYLLRSFFFVFILILVGFLGRSFFISVVPEAVCCCRVGAGDGEETVEASGFSVETAGVPGETVGRGDGGRSLAAKPS